MDRVIKKRRAISRNLATNEEKASKSANRHTNQEKGMIVILLLLAIMALICLTGGCSVFMAQFSTLLAL